MPRLADYIDMYCERTAPGLFNEPLNVLSNFGFIIVAFVLLRMARKTGKTDFSSYFLIFMVMIVGIGSMVFHATARMWAAVFADILPIAIFAAVFIYLFSRHILKFGWAGSLLLFTLFLVENIIFKSLVMRAPDGYISLIPGAIFLVLLCVYMAITKNPSAMTFTRATLVAVVAIIFRVIDLRICEYFPVGTHFLWHALMSVFMFLAVRELLRQRESIS